MQYLLSKTFIAHVFITYNLFTQGCIYSTTKNICVKYTCNNLLGATHKLPIGELNAVNVHFLNKCKPCSEARSVCKIGFFYGTYNKVAITGID